MKARKIKVTCDQCSSMVINGLFCHEHGCPNEYKSWEGEEWVKYYKCAECGFSIKEGDLCSCNDEDQD